MVPVPAEIAALYRGRSLRDRVRMRQRWFGTPYPAVAEEIPRRGRVVDAGCGFGLFAAYLATGAPEREVFGIDLDANKIARANALFGGVANVTFVEGDLASIPLPPCDAVVIHDVLHHLRDDVVDGLLAAAYTRLRPGGVLVVKENDTGPAWKRGVSELVEFVAVGGGITRSEPWRFRTVSEWRSALQAAGFDVRRAEPIRAHNYGRLIPHSLLVGIK